MTEQFPQAVESERAILGRILSEGGRYLNALRPNFKAEWLFKPAHRALLDLCERINASTDYWDAQTVIAKAIDAGTLEALGGAADILSMLDCGPFLDDHTDFHIALVTAKWRQRETLKAAASLQSACLGDADHFPAELERFQNAISGLSVAAGGRDLIRRGSDIVPDIMSEFQAAYDAREENPNYRNWPASGIAEIDQKIGGLVRDNWIIGAETSGGKTALMLQLACSALAAGQNVLIFSLEMEAEMLVKRMLSCAGTVAMKSIIEKAFVEHDMARLTNASLFIGSPRLSICDQPLPINQIESVAKAEHAVRPVDFLGVDYIQIVPSDMHRRGESRQQEVGRTSQALKRLQRSLGCMAVFPTQLNDDGKVREARDIMMDAAIGLRVQEDGIFIMKNRNGPRGVLMDLWLNGYYQRFEPIQQPKKVTQ